MSEVNLFEEKRTGSKLVVYMLEQSASRLKELVSKDAIMQRNKDV